jgi:hypothetical protein
VSNWYYLVAQLPYFSVSSASTTAQLPITEESFFELCSRFLDRKSMKILRGLSLEPPKSLKKTGSVVVDSWNEMENNLRFALAIVRAQKLKKVFDVPAVSLHLASVQAARTAVGLDSPLAAEQYLNDFRLECVGQITGFGIFSADAVFAYALKLKLAYRMKKFNEEEGIASYHKIYDQILGETK